MNRTQGAGSNRVRHHPGTLTHLPPLDGLRAVAILSVMAGHLLYWNGGALGVDVFFVVSGYLITAILLREVGRTGRLDLRHFYIRRFLRLMPAYWLMLAVTALFVAITSVRSPIGRGLLHALTYTTNVANAARPWDTTYPSLWEFTWSLAAEEQFYLIWPLLLAAIWRVLPSPHRRIASLAVPATLFGVSWLWSLELASGSPSGLRISNGPDTRSTMILVGCALAGAVQWRRHSDGPTRWSGPATYAGAVVLVAALAAFPQRTPDAFAVFAPLVALGTATLVAGLLAGPSLLSRLFSWAPLVLIGRWSYSLYLYHVLARASVRVALEAWFPGLLHRYELILVVTLSFVLAAMSYYVVERPFLRLKDRLPRRPRVADYAQTGFAAPSVDIAPTAGRVESPSFPK